MYRFTHFGYVNIYVHNHIHIYIYVYINALLSLCINRQTNKQTKKHTSKRKQTNKQTNKHTSKRKQTNKQTNKHTKRNKQTNNQPTNQTHEQTKKQASKQARYIHTDTLLYLYTYIDIRVSMCWCFWLKRRWRVESSGTTTLLYADTLHTVFYCRVSGSYNIWYIYIYVLQNLFCLLGGGCGCSFLCTLALCCPKGAT